MRLGWKALGAVLLLMLPLTIPDGDAAHAAVRANHMALQNTVSADAPAGSGEARLDAGQAAKRMEQAAERLYSYVLEGNIPKAREEMETVSNLFLSVSFQGRTTVDGVNALSGVIMDMQAAISRVKMNPEEWEHAAARLRLAANALNREGQPTWTQYYKGMQDDFERLEQAAASGGQTEWKRGVERLQTRYDTIRPAVLIAGASGAVNAFDAWISYASGLGTSPSKPERSQMRDAVSYGRDAVRLMFGKEKDEPVLSLPLHDGGYGKWGYLAAAFILTALAYAGIRKYRGERGEPGF